MRARAPHDTSLLAFLDDDVGRPHRSGSEHESERLAVSVRGPWFTGRVLAGAADLRGGFCAFDER